jgi:hypothetical protein
LKRSFAVMAAPSVFGLTLAVSGIGGAPTAAAGPDAACQDPAYTTAIVYPSEAPYSGHAAFVACVPVSVVSRKCTAPLGEPHTILYPLGQGDAPQCRSIYSQ